MQSKKIHICHLVYSFDVGGLERIIVNCINSLNNEIFNHTIISLTDTGQFLSEVNVPLEHYSLHKKSGNDFSIYRKLYQLLRDLRPDVLHSYNLGTIEYQWVGLFAGVPRRIHAEHGRDSYDPNGSVRKYRIIRKVCSAAINKVVTVSSDLRDWLEYDVKVSKSKLELIINGVDTDFFKPEDEYSANAQLYENKFVFGHVARLHEIKNQKFFLTAFLKACQSSSAFANDAVLVIVGDGPDREKLSQYVTENEELVSRVFFVGAQTDVKEYYSFFDVFLMSSIAEGIPMTLLESMSISVPHLVTDVGGIKEVVCSGSTGLSVDSGDLDGYVNAMMDLYEHPNKLEVMSRQAREHIINNFSQNDMVAAYHKLYCKG